MAASYGIEITWEFRKQEYQHCVRYVADSRKAAKIRAREEFGILHVPEAKIVKVRAPRKLIIEGY